jgi:hypothetical protein
LTIIFAQSFGICAAAAGAFGSRVCRSSADALGDAGLPGRAFGRAAFGAAFGAVFGFAALGLAVSVFFAVSAVGSDCGAAFAVFFVSAISDFPRINFGVP